MDSGKKKSNFDAFFNAAKKTAADLAGKARKGIEESGVLQPFDGMTPDFKEKAQAQILKVINENPHADDIVTGGLGVVDGKIVHGNNGTTVRELQMVGLENGDYLRSISEFVSKGYGSKEQGLKAVLRSLDPDYASMLRRNSGPRHFKF